MGGTLEKSKANTDEGGKALYNYLKLHNNIFDNSQMILTHFGSPIGMTKIFEGGILATFV